MGKNIFKRMRRQATKAVNKSVNKVDSVANKTSAVLEKIANQTADVIEETANKSVNAVSILANKLINGANTFSPSARQVLNKYGDQEVVRLEINRDPIPAPVQGILDNMGGRIGYDRLYHLRLNWYLADGTKGIMEKNEVINIATGIVKTQAKGQKMSITEKPNATLAELLHNAKAMMGKDFFSYSVSNNCQKFIDGILKSNGINNKAYTDFLLQDTENLFKGKEGLRKFANTTTDIAGRFNMLAQGGSIKRIAKKGILCFD